MNKKLSVSQKRKKNSKKNPKDLARACGMIMESKRKKNSKKNPKELARACGMIMESKRKKTKYA